MARGRFAPSPSGRLHLGNLRTALIAWLFARSEGSDFYFRFEDLGPRQLEHYDTQIADFLAIGLDYDGEVIRQLDRLDRYRDAVSDLVKREMVYECFCSRKEIREAASAPNHAFAGHSYPGTCRTLTRAQRQAKVDSGRPPALRVRAEAASLTFDDVVAGSQQFSVDDFVVQRNDGIPAYHLVVVVDDHAQGIELVVRADDLLPSTARHLYLYQLFGLEPPGHAHVPLVLAPDGERLAKRHGAVSLPDQVASGRTPAQVLAYLASTLGLADPHNECSPADLVALFDPENLPTTPLTLPPAVIDPRVPPPG